MLKQVQKGFTLIELMIVVAIIGILAAIAIPAYQDYTIRSQVSEGLNLAGAVKAAVAETYAQTGEWPTTLADIGIDAVNRPSGKYVESVDIVNPGTIRVTFGRQANAELRRANQNQLDIRPALSPNNDVMWECGYFTIDPAPTYTDAAGVASAAKATNVLQRYLPQSCRGAAVTGNQ
jgi:type IV pilus assembly protein PilA